MEKYKYVIDLNERGNFQAHVEDHDGKVIWEVNYPETHYDEMSGEEIESSTIFDDGYMSDPDDLEGLEDHLKQMGVLPQGAELLSEDDYDDYEEENEDDDYADGGPTKGYNPAQDIIDSIYGSAGTVYRVAADIGEGKVGLTPWYTKAVIDDVIKDITEQGYKILNVEQKQDEYMDGGQIHEADGTFYYPVTFKTYRNFPATWRVLFVWGKNNYVSVRKVTNNPFGMLGTEFKNLDEAISHYKSGEMKVLLLQAADVAKKAGYPDNKEGGGETDNYAKGGELLASSPTLDGIKNAIGKYYYSSSITLQKIGDTDEYEVSNAKGKINGVKVSLKKGRYQFLRTMASGGKVSGKASQAEKKARLKKTLEKYGIGGKAKKKSFKQMTFKEKSASIANRLEGSKVSPKYQKQYGKTYDKDEAQQAANAITGKIVSKME